MWHPSFVQQWRETGGIGQELSWGFKTHWPYGPPVRGSLPCTLDSPCSGIWFSNPGQWVRYSGCRRRQEAEQMISTSQAICGTWASSSRQCFSCKGGSPYWHPTGLPALWAFLSVPGWEGEESCWSGPVQKVLLGKMDINRHAWKVECVFCCGRVQVEPQIIDFLKIALQTTLGLEPGGRYALQLNNVWREVYHDQCSPFLFSVISSGEPLGENWQGSGTYFAVLLFLGNLEG